MSWLQAHLVVDSAEAPRVERLFETLGALSVTLADAEDQPMLEPPLGTMPLWSRTRVTGLFSGETDPDTLRGRIDTALGRDNSRHLTLEPLDDRPWERAWLDHFHPMSFGRRLWICPSGQRPPQGDAVVVELDPGLAFGTGTHPTTALCLDWLDGADLTGKEVIDYGCGSGILALAALALGAKRVIAVDHDPQALQATAENARRNGLTQGLECHLPDQLPPCRADLVLANILANVLIELAPRLVGLLAPRGRLVLSGILAEQALEVAAAYAPPLTFSPPRQRQEWILLEGHHG